jgi:RNA polymerase sigma-70 factor, ECF subfamily
MGEADIIAKLKEGDEKAFREFVEKYRQMVVNTCFGLLHNDEDAEDVSQEVFIEVFRSVKNFRYGSKVSTWLYRIAVNRSLNFIRNNRKHRWFSSSDEEVKLKMNILKQTASDYEGNPEFDLETRQTSVLLHEAVDSLPRNQRVAFTLSKYEDLSQKEIAEVMKLSVASVESLIHRAKKNLQKKLYIWYKKKYI